MRFFKTALLAIGLSVFGGVSAADADVTWLVSGTFTDGTTLSGSFTTDVYGYVSNWDLATQALGAFAAFQYDPSTSYLSSGPTFVDFEPGYSNDLHLEFSSPLTVPSTHNTILDALSYECQGSYSCYVPAGGVVRYLSGGSPSDFAVAAVPEPTTWALLIVAFGALGAMMRFGRRRAAIAA